MATKIVEKVTLKIGYDAGIVDEKQRTKYQNYNKISESATDDKMYAVGVAISELCSKDVLSIYRSEDAKLLSL